MAPTSTRPFEPVEVVSPKRGLTVLLSADQTQIFPDGKSVLVKRGAKVKFKDGMATITKREDYELLVQHPAFTGGQEPKVVFLMREADLMPPSVDGVRVVNGAISSSTGSRAAEPIPGYDKMQYAALRKAIQTGAITDFPQAIAYERTFRNRRGVMELFAAAIVAAALPSAKQMQESDAAGDPDVDTANPGDAGTDPLDAVEGGADMAAALAAAEAIDEAIDGEQSVAVPPEGVL